MLFSTTFFYLMIGAGAGLGLPALWLFARAKWPNLVERGKSVSSGRLAANFFIGLPVVVVILFLGFKMGGSGIQQLQVGAIIFAGLALVWSFAGAAGLATYVGEILWPHFTGNESWRTTWKGGQVVVGCLLLPFVGWFLLSLLLLVIGCGIQVRCFFAGKKVTAVAAPPLPVAQSNAS